MHGNTKIKFVISHNKHAVKITSENGETVIPTDVQRSLNFVCCCQLVSPFTGTNNSDS